MSIDRNANTDIRQRRAIQQLANRSLPAGQPGQQLVATGTNAGDAEFIDGIILKSPNGNYWLVSIDNAGAISTTNLGSTYPP